MNIQVHKWLIRCEASKIPNFFMLLLFFFSFTKIDEQIFAETYIHKQTNKSKFCVVDHGFEQLFQIFIFQNRRNEKKPHITRFT